MTSEVRVEGTSEEPDIDGFGAVIMRTSVVSCVVRKRDKAPSRYVDEMVKYLERSIQPIFLRLHYNICLSKKQRNNNVCCHGENIIKKKSVCRRNPRTRP